jgi:hypothetical protein
MPTILVVITANKSLFFYVEYPCHDSIVAYFFKELVIFPNMFGTKSITLPDY